MFLGKEPRCKSKVDVGYILDSSGSLKADYQNEKNFLKSLAESFGVSGDGSRAGVITFSVNAEHSIKMKDHADISSFNAAVDAIPLMGFTTRIDKALRLAQNELFTLENGARPTTPKILILLTDGSQTADADAESPGDIADELRKTGVTLLVVGIGSHTNTTELSHIAGGPGKTFSAASFDELTSARFIGNIADKSCEVGKYELYYLNIYFSYCELDSRQMTSQPCTNEIHLSFHYTEIGKASHISSTANASIFSLTLLPLTE